MVFEENSVEVTYEKTQKNLPAHKFSHGSLFLLNGVQQYLD